MNKRETLGTPFQFVGEGEMVERINRHDWAATPIGPIESWPDGLRSAVSIALASSFQLVVFAGRDLVYIYNDASISIFGDKHPWALGTPTREVWDEIWPTIGPILHSVLDTGKAIRFDDLLLVLQRHGFEEDAYFTVSYSAIRELDGSISGLFGSVMETTTRVINERRMRTLSELAAAVASARGEEAFPFIGATLAANAEDVPFAAMYLCGSEGAPAQLVFANGERLPPGGLPAGMPLAAGQSNPIACTVRSRQRQVFETAELAPSAADAARVPARCVSLPLTLPGAARPDGVLVLGVNPRKALDKQGFEFYQLVAGHMATAIANAQAARRERERIEALAELDRSKTAFLASASHELRTPLTLIEGPIGTLLDDPREVLSPAAREALEMTHRNTARMKVLVNSLLDFARIEAGHMVAQLEPSDLGALTAELASMFRSSFAAAGVAFQVHSRSGLIHTLVDREMWEKIVLNLLSNALKYTPSGSVEIALRSSAGLVELAVSDTGIGIAADDLPLVAQRFYRSSRRQSRELAEGTGLGLALVTELARLHEGTLSIDSVEGKGTTVTVRIPARPVAPDQVASPDSGASGWKTLTRAVFTEARHTRGALLQEEPAPAPDPSGRPNVVVIDDNEDILRYVERLLKDACNVTTAADAATGLGAVHARHPDVVLLDVMMPEVDGFEVLRHIRSDPDVQSVSVIVLSAHVGEEARLEAMAAGADDYLPKPFSGRELVATVRSHFNLARIRRNAMEREGALLSQIADIRGSMDSVIEGTSDAFIHLDRDLRVLAINDVAVQLAGMPREQIIGQRFPEIRRSAGAILQALAESNETRRVIGADNYHRESGRWFNVRCYPVPDGVIVLANDITVRKQAEWNLLLEHEELEVRVRERTADLNEANALLRALFDRAPAPIAMTDLEGRVVRANQAFIQLLGYGEMELERLTIRDLTAPEDYNRKRHLLDQLLAGSVPTFELEMRYRRKGGETLWVENFVGTIPDDTGKPRYIVKIVQDITERKHAEQMIQASQAELRTLYDRLQRVRKDERIALAREVHDHLGQLLSAAKIDIKLLLEDMRDATGQVQPSALVPELESASDSLEQAISSVRSIARELRPAETDSHGLYAAIRWHAQDFERRTRIQVALSLPDDPRGPTGAAAFELFRIFQEAATNVLRHAMATQVWVTLDERGDRLLLRVRDNGVGIARGRPARATLGLIGMRERAALCGGRVLVGPLAGGGTLVSALFPRAPERPVNTA